MIDFWSILGPYLHPQNLKNRAPAGAGARFFKKSSFEVMYVFDPIWVPTCLHFPSPNAPQSLKHRFQEASIFLNDLGIDLLSILAPFWKPTWGQWAPRGGHEGPQIEK